MKNEIYNIRVIHEPRPRAEPDSDEIALCWDCEGFIGGAAAGPDVPWHPAGPGEICGADGCGVTS